MARLQHDVTCNLETVGKYDQGLISLSEVLILKDQFGGHTFANMHTRQLY